MDSPGERFARALAHQDKDALCAVLADTVDFQALTPRRHWQASTGRQAAEEIILGTGSMPGRRSSSCARWPPGRWRTASTSPTGCGCARTAHDYLVEQQAYYRTDGPRITWMRILCSGYQPIVAEPAPARG